MSKPSRKQKEEVAARLGDLSDLPPELLTQLVVPQEADARQAMALEQIAKDDGRATLDDILIDIWRTHRIVWKRRDLHQILYRLKASSKVRLVAKGVYEVTKHDQ